MSREIKFRGWYTGPHVNRMLEPNFNGPVNEIFNDPDNEGKVIYMQYTGLKDKHGTEIFEGDILKCKCWDKRKSSIDGFDPLGETPYFYRNSVIEWWRSHCNLGYRLRDGKGKTLMIKPSSLNAMEVEVIGNIYEHKHLLEETA